LIWKEVEPLDTENLEALIGLNSEDLGKVISLLRSDKPIHTEVRLLLAEMLDPTADGTNRLILGRRKSNRPKSSDTIIHDITVGKEAYDLRKEIGKGGYESAISETAKKNNVSVETVKKAYSLWKSVEERLENEPDDLV
jgi:hypothetical protein